ncbi:hypothetical protein EG68_04681 [Paragonimus skrjabini miyazakii]|uniref:Uncharacterized protein n=1 Tax=Paragonimus skrjabini miyazakii TaxID=59628 RepID=A0A8S9YSK6_9TREM|nr:hypothetical protein EG68_04681 [Paragonimus skrjabini miyazakii]
MNLEWIVLICTELFTKRSFPFVTAVLDVIVILSSLLCYTRSVFFLTAHTQSNGRCSTADNFDLALDAAVGEVTKLDRDTSVLSDSVGHLGFRTKPDSAV